MKEANGNSSIAVLSHGENFGATSSAIGRWLKMMDDIAMAVKPFIMLTTNGDLPTNWMRLGECMVCGEVFTREQSRKHSEARCQPSPDQPLSIKGRGSKSEHKTQTWQ
jgi:hypothetical protein